MVLLYPRLILSWLLFFAIVTNSFSLPLPSMDLHQKHVITECAYTTYPSLCINALKNSSDDQRSDFMSVLVNQTIFATNLHVSKLDTLGGDHSISEEEAQNTRKSIGYCHELMILSLRRLKQAQMALQESPAKHKQDIQTWVSAVITFQETCKDIADQHAALDEQMKQLSKNMAYLSQLGSNLLALVNRITGTPRNGTYKGGHEFPEWVPGRERKLLQSDTFNANVVVAKDGTGHYRTISEAIKAATGRRFVIYVKAGVYNERIRCIKDDVTLIGDGKYNTIITWAYSVAGGHSLQGTATFTITGDGFIAKDIGFQNTAGPNAEQAVALAVASDQAVFYKCAIMGYQDTLYAQSLRQFYRECDIYGTIDFIFGNAAAVFQNCVIALRRPSGIGAYNVILANGRTDSGQNTGFSLHNCKITVGSDFYPVKNSFSSYIGRPWKSHSRAVVLQSVIDDAISPRGWIEWPVNPGSSLGTLYFAEYGNTGPGAWTYGRVKWNGFHVIGRDEANWYTVGNFIGGWSWLPSTGVSFFPGLR